jgi:hypothetical protein
MTQNTSDNKAEKNSGKVILGFTLYGFSNPDTTIFAGPEGSIVFYGASFLIDHDKYILLPRPTDGVDIPPYLSSTLI